MLEDEKEFDEVFDVEASILDDSHEELLPVGVDQRHEGLDLGEQRSGWRIKNVELASGWGILKDIYVEEKKVPCR